MRVLIVEDHPSVATYVKRALTEQGYAVDHAHTGLEAFEWAEIVSFDLIVLDIMLPEMDGMTVCRRLRSEGNQAAIFMLTARDTVDDRVVGLDAGADDYLVKPFDVKELLARLRALDPSAHNQNIDLRIRKSEPWIRAPATCDAAICDIKLNEQRICDTGMFDS